MDKTKALERLSSLEEEAKKLRVIIEKADEPKPITERVKTFTDAKTLLGSSDSEVIKYNKMVNAGINGSVLAFQKLAIIIKALNEGWKPNWNNSNEYKYYPYFIFEGVSFRFSYCSSYDLYDSGVSSHLLLKSRELSIYAGQQFINEYNEYLLNK